MLSLVLGHMIGNIARMKCNVPAIGRRLCLPTTSTGRRVSSSLHHANKEKKSQHQHQSEMNGIVPDSEFAALGLQPILQEALHGVHLKSPTAVQRAVIPLLLNRENLVIAASTGSGKTLAFSLPVLQHLLQQEQQTGYIREAQRPRVLVLVPTRDLARQVLSSIKSLSHVAKVSSCAVVGGEPYSQQTQALARTVDIVVGSPGRLLQHRQQGHVYFSRLTHVIIDEVDTMLMQGFGPDIRSILNGAMKPRVSIDKKDASGIAKEVTAPPVQLIMATATLTSAVKALLGTVESGFDVSMPALQTRKDKDSAAASVSSIVGMRAGGAGSSSPVSNTPCSRVIMKQIEVEGLHHALPHVKHSFIDIKGNANKLDTLKAEISKHENKGDGFRTLIFCNRVSSAQAVQHYLAESGRTVPSYHGELNSIEREANLLSFRSGKEQYLVCTDLAARGLDVPEIDHVIMFDFPLNPIDYLHRSGRCGRAGRAGIVTSLLQKKDQVLGYALRNAVMKGLPIDLLSSSKRDYLPGGKLGVSAEAKKADIRERTGRKGYSKDGPHPLSSFSLGKTFKSRAGYGGGGGGKGKRVGAAAAAGGGRGRNTAPSPNAPKPWDRDTAPSYRMRGKKLVR